MARSFGAESLGADGFAVRGAVSAAPAIGCALIESGSNQLGWTASPVALASDLSLLASTDYVDGELNNYVPKAGGTMTGPLVVNTGSNPVHPIETHSNFALGLDLYVHADAGFRAPYIQFNKSRGSQFSPGPPTLTGYEQDSIGGINFNGWDGSQYFTAAGIYTQVSNNWSSSQRGAAVAIYGTRSLPGYAPQQIMQFGGLDATDQATLNGNGADFNILSYRPIAFGGNKQANPMLSYTLGSLGVPAKFNMRAADESGWADLAAGNATIGGNTGLLKLNNTNSGAVWQLRAEYGDLNIEPSSGTTNGIALRASSGYSIVQNVAGSNIATVSSSGLSVTGAGTFSTSVSSTAIYPLAYVGAPAGCSITASGGSSGTMVLSCGGVQQISLANTRMTIPSDWMIDFTNGNWNQTVEARIIRSSPNVLDIRANAGLRIRSFDGTAGSSLQASVATFSSSVTAGNINVSASTAPTIKFPDSGSLTLDEATINGGINRYFLTLATNGRYLRWQGNGSLVLDNIMSINGSSIRAAIDSKAPSLVWGLEKLSVVGSGGFGNGLDCGTITQGSSDARWTIPGTGQRTSQVGNGAGTWQTGYREAYNVAGVQCGFFGATPVGQQSIAAAATDAASTQTLANSLRTAMINLGLGA